LNSPKALFANRLFWSHEVFGYLHSRQRSTISVRFQSKDLLAKTIFVHRAHGLHDTGMRFGHTR
jgi:hypothetical protein